MSWSDARNAAHRQGRRRLLRLLAGLPLLAVPLAGGCGFQPLYGKTQTGAVSDDLSTVRIAPLSERNGQTLHNLLRDRFNPYGQPTQPRYELKMTLAETSEETGLQRDETETRVTLTLQAFFVLIDLQSGEAVTQGQSRSSSGYNILDDRFASTVSANDAYERALTQLADDIKLRIASYFSGQRD